MQNLVTFIHVLAAAGVIGLVLLQHGKGADMGAAFGSGASGSLFGVSGSTNFSIPDACMGHYEKDVVAEFKSRIDTCHIYIIGTLPAVELTDVREEDGNLVIGLAVSGERHELSWPIPGGAKMIDTDRGKFLENDGLVWAPSEHDMMWRLKGDEQDAIRFDVLYVGQAYGKDRSRNALDRLLKHETLQKISSRASPQIGG
jgi:hypothetical protein